MNRAQRRIFDKKHRNGYDTCPICGYPSEFIAVPTAPGKCIPACIRCGRVAGQPRPGDVPKGRIIYIKLAEE